MKLEAGFIKIITSLDDFHSIEKFFREKNIELFESKMDYTYDTENEITEFEKALKFVKMLQAFDEDEDVNFVSSNEHISDELLKEVEEFIEKNTFRT